MPAEEDYGQRRQHILQQHGNNGTSSPLPHNNTITSQTSEQIRYHSPVPANNAVCPAGCTTTDRIQTNSTERLSTDTRSNPNERIYTNTVERDGERSHHSTLDRHHGDQRERYHGQSSERLLSERLQGSGIERYGAERHRYSQPDRFQQVPNVNSLDRYGSLGTNLSTTDRYQNTHEEGSSSSNRSLDRYATTGRYTKEHNTSSERFNNQSETQMYQQRIPQSQSTTSDRFPDRYSTRYQDRFQNNEYQQERYNCERYNTTDRFPQNQERTFSSQERIQFPQVPYIPPPSPAPASDRFIPPPPLSPANTPSPDCYPSNPFPSPTTAPPPERFIPPPPLSPSPTEKYPPKPERFDGVTKRYQDRYTLSPNPEKYTSGERYQQYSANDPRFQERYQCYPDRFHQYQTVQDRFGNTTERYIPPTAHTPVERYVPQPQEPYYHGYQTYERYPKWNGNSGDPYMRRDLGYHHHYRLPVPFQANYQRIRYNHVGTPNRVKCCQYQDFTLSKSSPGSSSSSSVTSQGKEIQAYIQNPVKDLSCYHQGELIQQPFHQEKGIQCVNLIQGKDVNTLQCVSFGQNTLRASKQVPCKHVCSSPGVEYVGQAGGRVVCATPPPPRPASGGPEQCGDQCCLRRPQNTVLTTSTPAVWRPAPSQPQPSSPPSQSTTENAPSQNVEQKPTPSVQRAVSLPAPSPYQEQSPSSTSSAATGRRILDYSQSERLPGQQNRERPRFARSGSRKEAIKNFIKKETATFFGVDEESEEDQQLKWLDRRKRLASRTLYGPLKDEYLAHRRPATVSFARSDATQSERLSQAQAQAEAAQRPDVLPAPSQVDVPDHADERWPERVTVRRKDSVARMTWDGISYVVTTLTKHRPRPRSQTRAWSRSYPPEQPQTPTETLEDEVFFERPTTPTSPGSPEVADSPDAAPLEPRPPPQPRYSRTGAPAWRIEPHRRQEQQRPEIGGRRIWSAMLDSVLDNSDRRQYGMGWVGKMFGRSMRSSVARDEKIKQQLDDLEDYRPMFTYWVTTVQVLVLAISLVCYGFGPFGIDLQQRSGQVLVTSLSLQQVEYLEPANFWFGPRAADLIHLGAKFSPCMRIDNKINKQIDKTREKERETACCIRNDDSGCVQSSKADCSKTISTWKKWSAGDSGPGGRISGSVCGLDPKFCDAPASVHPYEWPDDITKWPICRKTNSFTTQRKGQSNQISKTAISKDKLAEHMVCEVIGHPCCIGIHGQCRITTREYCDFVRGHFHEEASLCSQVSCLDDVCGMIPFYFAEVPDQFYRLWTSLFLHAGVLQLIVTILIQHYLMRDLEKLTGPLRIGIIYIGSGVGGNLASSIFVPYRADVGPSGSQFGLLACLIVEILNSWPMLKHPHHALLKLLSITFVLFLFGLLPWVDNYSHLFGFIFGFLLSYAFLPFVSFGPYERQKKIALIWVCLISAGILFICLVLLFYIIPVYDCEICSYLNCIPLTRDFCASQNINFMREEPVV